MFMTSCCVLPPWVCVLGDFRRPGETVPELSSVAPTGAPMLFSPTWSIWRDDCCDWTGSTDFCESSHSGRWTEILLKLESHVCKRLGLNTYEIRCPSSRSEGPGRDSTIFRLDPHLDKTIPADNRDYNCS
jgi:hypothetical protein